MSGWVLKGRDFGGMTFIDLRDRYGITQLVFNMEPDATLCNQARQLGREWVINIQGKVRERSNKNPNRATGDIEIDVGKLVVLNSSKTPPFTIEDKSDGGEDLRMKYRYLDMRRSTVKEKILFRHQVALETRKHLSGIGFTEVETPFLIKSTPEGARDFVVPSRVNPGQFYALPQSPQTFKQLLMIAGMDKYFQIVKCFRDEDLRADRQPEFTQIDCEMSFVTREEVLQTFEGLIKYLYRQLKNIELDDFPVMLYDEAIRLYGTDKPDLRFGMQFVELTDAVKGFGFHPFDQAELVVGISAPGQSPIFSNRDLNDLIDWVKRPQIGAQGLVYVKYNEDGSIKTSVSKFYSEERLLSWVKSFEASPGDMFLIMSGEASSTRKQLSELRLEMARRIGLIDPEIVKPLWVVDFPLLEWDDESQRFYAMHHPFTSPVQADVNKMESDDREVLASLRANAYDLVINGSEIGGGSIRIHDRSLQEKNFELLGFTQAEAERQFGFLMSAFEYGAPPHGGIAFGFDRLCAVMQGHISIRDYIAFPKNNMGRDVMIDAPSEISKDQLKELGLSLI